MAPNVAVCLTEIPSEPTVVFRDSSLFADSEIKEGNIRLPNLSEVLAESQAQNSPEAHKKPNPPPVYFESLGLVVKFGRDDTVSISEGQCLWALRTLLPSVPVPVIYGWSTEQEYVLLYMEKVKGVTVEKVWPTMTDDQKNAFWRNLQFVVSELRTLSQDPDNQFLGMNGTFAEGFHH